MIGRLYIDPGKHFHALAYFADGVLHWTAYQPVDADNTDSFRDLSALVIEKPKLRGDDSKDPNDCLDVYGAARLTEGFIRARGGPAALYVFPEDWKGGFKKPPHHRKVWAALTPYEREVFARDVGLEVEFIGAKIQKACETLARTRKVSGYKWAAHNLLDAVGIGLWHQCRLMTGRMVSPLWESSRGPSRVAKV